MKHGREKFSCKDFGGSGICENGKRKARCKDCGGSGDRKIFFFLEKLNNDNIRDFRKTN